MRYCRSGWRWQTKRRGGALRWPRNRKFVDSLLEGAVCCELVSEKGLDRWKVKPRFQGVYG